MKYLKLFEEFENKEIGEVHMEDGWRIHQLDRETFDWFINRFYEGKVWIASEGDFEIYYWDNTSKEDGEDIWHTKVAIYEDSKYCVIKTKELLSEPVYKPRDPELTIEQESTLRRWVGTVKKPKHNQFIGGYLGVDKNGIAKFRSPHSGSILTIDRDGEVIIPE